MQGIGLGWIFWALAAIHCGYENPACAQSEKQERVLLFSPSAAAFLLLVNI